ncbi:50S ribosomal protein L23 [Candidatus Gottesmanbacteria bacterium RIFCSPHIGHO2_01_FULL_46_14]|uniref:Large ribosomal subunit protein uL23 n=3 Tax=Candidatus Gottesmaniibacteriota TaxID=1752720 RepID=A0A1F5ZSZ8_9BACT|nr:MAG: 50S ribosomal protein L23 [Candidatus Gottesmanbacteria bacterium GW2011_GWA1_47_8]OGG15252.1 MAG: 50S ribosomal protein L23 [Candidatus Gottesmanbacteria bacterium RIFCSPHIGHO2_01_FULL_46_14]OGG28665.1 MAG: 50S ribosomal protein L23 [Candidatus Gottesmanbacteria bacterium RIFCSPLOWO2_01_FULL_46_21]
MNQTVRRPLITEKSLSQAAKGWYTFAVTEAARKQDIAREIGQLYNVNVTDVRTASMHGKERRAGKKMKRVAKSDWKKAVVHLVKGQTIAAFEVTQEAEKK